MDIVLGAAMAPSTVRVVLVEGESADGVTIDQESFAVTPNGPTGGASAAAEHVVEAILGTRESAAHTGYRVLSSGVSWTDPHEATALRHALDAHQMNNVVLVSAFVAAASLAQAVGAASNRPRTALLFVEPTTATLAMIETARGEVIDVRRQDLPPHRGALIAELAALVSAAELQDAHPDGVFLVGCGVDVPRIKQALEAATSVAVTAPEEPEMALARGAALASASASLAAPATIAMAYAQESPSGSGTEPVYRAATEREAPLPRGRRSRKAVLAASGAIAIFVGGAVALALALALGIRPHADQRPSLSRNVVAPASQAPSKPQVVAPPAPADTPAPASAVPTQAPAPAASPSEQEPSQHPRSDDRWGHHHLGHGFDESRP